MVRFPDGLYVSEVIPNYGAYKISSVYKVGELDKRGGQVLSWTVSELLGVPVDGFLAQDREVGTDVKGFFLNPGIFWKSKSNLNSLDLLRFVYSLFQMRFDKIDQVDLGKYAGPLVLADGTTALGVDKEQLDSALAWKFVESTIRDEGLRVEVVNSTPVVALGARVARVLTNIGMMVINVGSSRDVLGSCQVEAGKKNINSMTVLRIAQIYACRVSVRSEESRADVTVTLGKDYAQMFNR